MLDLINEISCVKETSVLLGGMKSEYCFKIKQRRIEKNKINKTAGNLI